MTKGTKRIMERADRVLADMHAFAPASPVQADRKARRIADFNRLTTEALRTGDWTAVAGLADELEIA